MYHTGSIKINVAVLTPVVIALLNKMGSQTTPPHPTKGGNVDSKAKKPKWTVLTVYHLHKPVFSSKVVL